MMINERLRTAENWILGAAAPEWPLALKFIHRLARIVYAVARDFAKGDMTLHAMSLVYTTLLSIVPLLALSFSVLKAMGVHNRMAPLLHNVLEPMGEQGMEIAENVLMFVDNIKVGVLGSLGLGLLVYTVISLVQKIETSFNYIWRVPHLRSVAQRFSNYLSVIMVGPLLVVSAVGLTATVMNSSLVQWLTTIEPFGSVILLVSKLTPFLFIIGAFTFVYIFMPNTRVKLKSALIGGVIAGVTWQLTGVLFATLVAGSTKYSAIYSGFAVGIVLLIWIYLCWQILLLGSSIAYYHQYSDQVTRDRTIKSSPQLDESLGLAIMVKIARLFDEGNRPISQETLETKMPVPPQMTRRITDKLIRQHMLEVAGDKGDCLVPARSLDRIQLTELLQALRKDEEQLMNRWDEAELSDVLGDLQGATQNVLAGRTLADVIRHQKASEV